MKAEQVLTQEQLVALIDDAMDVSCVDLSHRPLPAVLDTDFVRTGLHYQVRKGIPPRSVRTAQQGSLRLFMEYDTLTETGARLPKFAGQLDMPVADLRRILNEGTGYRMLTWSSFPPHCGRLIRGHSRSETATPTISRQPRWPPCCRRACCSPATTSTSTRWAYAPGRRASMA
jgi:hypothetical protein